MTVVIAVVVFAFLMPALLLFAWPVGIVAFHAFRLLARLAALVLRVGHKLLTRTSLPASSVTSTLLTGLLRDPSSATRLHATKQLGRLGSGAAQAVPDLMAVLDGAANAEVLKTVNEALSSIVGEQYARELCARNPAPTNGRKSVVNALVRGARMGPR